MYWERHINTDLSRGWMLLYSLPTAIVREFDLLVVARVFIILHRKRKKAERGAGNATPCRAWP
jgi:hypothetical protein